MKDRAALYLIKDAEEKGLLKPGGIIVEGTAGNTGIGLALVANAKGYKTVIVIPQTQSQVCWDACNCSAQKKINEGWEAMLISTETFIKFGVTLSERERDSAKVFFEGSIRGTEDCSQKELQERVMF